MAPAPSNSGIQLSDLVFSATRDGQDYTMAQGLESVIMGASMGGAFHAAFGGFGDIRNRARGLPLEGSPQDLLLRGLLTGTHVHADALAERGVPLEEVPGIAPVEPAPQSNEDIDDLISKVEAQLLPAPVYPAEVLADLPPAARENAGSIVRDGFQSGYSLRFRCSRAGTAQAARGTCTLPIAN